MARRCDNLLRLNAAGDLQADALTACERDIVRWFNDWVWTYDPRKMRELSTAFPPMDLFPRQEEFLRWLVEREVLREDGLVPKSRDMGLTWLCSGFLIHHWLFVPGFKGAVGSRKKDLVDRVGDPDSIFEKMRMLLRNLPDWMMPAGFQWSKHDNHLKLVNPCNDATVTGEAGDNIGRGGRSSIYIIDEFAFIERADRVEAALSQNTDCHIYVSTCNGPATAFAKKRRACNISIFEMDWHDDPRKSHWQLVRESDSLVVESGEGGTKPPEKIPLEHRIVYPWYESEKKRIADPVIVAQELDRDDTASLEGVAIPARWVKAAVDLNKRINMPRCSYAAAGLDVADGGGCSNILVIRRGAIIEEVHERKEGGTTDTANWALAKALEAGARLLNYDCVGVGSGVSGAFAARFRDSGESRSSGLVARGVNVGNTPTNARWPDGRTAREWFTNLKAELWWTVRRRFEKTFEFVEEGVKHPVDELISIPNDSELICQLSNVLYFANESGKIQIESKQQLMHRGVKSPDRAEALMLCFAPSPTTLGRAVVGGYRKEVVEYESR